MLFFLDFVLYIDRFIPYYQQITLILFAKSKCKFEKNFEGTHTAGKNDIEKSFTSGIQFLRFTNLVLLFHLCTTFFADKPGIL
jgi:hypothetical protein